MGSLSNGDIFNDLHGLLNRFSRLRYFEVKYVTHTDMSYGQRYCSTAIGNHIPNMCARVQSPVGHNYVLCYERYGFKVEDDFRSISNLRVAVVRFQCSCLLLTAVNITFALQLIKLRAGILCTHECEWSRAQIDCILTASGTRDCL